MKNTLEEKAKKDLKERYINREVFDSHDMVFFAKIFTSQQVKEALEEAAENATCKKEYYPNGIDWYYISEVDKESILSIQNKY